MYLYFLFKLLFIYIYFLKKKKREKRKKKKNKDGWEEKKMSSWRLLLTLLVDKTSVVTSTTGSWSRGHHCVGCFTRLVRLMLWHLLWWLLLLLSLKSTSQLHTLTITSKSYKFKRILLNSFTQIKFVHVYFSSFFFSSLSLSKYLYFWFVFICLVSFTLVLIHNRRMIEYWKFDRFSLLSTYFFLAHNKTKCLYHID